MFKRIVIIACFALVLAACNQNAEKVQELEKEVMDIHDEVMPRMGTINTLQKSLRSRITALDSLQQEGVASNTQAGQRLKALELRQELTTADSLMMDWMYAYRGDSAKALPGPAAMEYFRLEKDKIQLVRERTDKSIEAAKEFLK